MPERDFEELSKAIERASNQMDALANRLAEVKKELASGDWGTQQLKEFRAEINKITTELEGKEELRAGLINEKQILESTKEFESLAKAIRTVETNLQRLYAERQKNPGGLLDVNIGDQERALASFQTRILRAYDALGKARPAKLESISDEKLAERLASGTKASEFSGNTILQGPGAGSERIRKIGLDIATRTLRQIQEELLRGAIEARVLDAAARAYPPKTISPGLQDATDRFLAIQRLSEARRRGPTGGEFRSNIFPELYPRETYPEPPEGGLATTVARPRRPFAPASPNTQYNEYLVNEALKKGFDNFFRGLSQYANRVALGAQGGGGRREGGYDTYGAFEDRVFRQKRLEAFREGRLPTFNDRVERYGKFDIPSVSSGADRAKEIQDRLNKSLLARVAAEEKYRQALEQAARQGFRLEDLKRVQTRGTAGIEQLQFERRDESGINRRFDTYVNPSGRATPGISNQFRSFGQGVVRDIGELTKWSLALAAVYGPMRKLQELTQIMIENQTRLAEAATSVSSAFIGQDEIFDASAESAARAGESIDGVIDAFTLAYRAAGGGGSEIERFASATDLLDNALILSKLSTLDQAVAIDTLAAALRQANGSISGGAELLDSWVRVTKIANVDLASLATGFAVLGDAAEAAGIGTDQLNGILAAIGETGVSSGRELANAARAIVAGFQSDQARQALENIGVAVEDTTGKMRPFLEIMQEVSNLREKGILDDTAFSRLTLALGGGTRRQAVYATFIENFSRVQEVADESSRASGDAQQALAKQLDTVQTAMTRMANAFQELAQTMGTDGGFLDIITGTINGLTKLISLFDDVVGLLGKATPAMLAFVAATVALKHQGIGSVQNYLGGLGSGIERDPVLQRLAIYGGAGRNAAVPARSGAGQFLQNNVLGTNLSSGAFQGLFTAALPAILNFTNQEDRYGKTKAGADIVGGIAGGLLGALTPLGPIIGAAIGTAAAEAFVNSTIARKTDIFGYQAPELEPAIEGVAASGAIQDLDERLRKAEAGLYESIGGGNEGLGKLLTSGQTSRAESLVDRINQAIEQQDKEALERTLGGKYGKLNTQFLSSLGITPEVIKQGFEEQRQIQFKPEYVAFNQATPQAQREFREAEAARAARGGTPLDQSTLFAELLEQNKEAFSGLLQGIKSATQGQLQQQRLSGEVRGAEYGRRTLALQDFDTRALQYYTALGEEVDRLTGGTDDAAAAFGVLNNVITGGIEDSLPQMTALKGEIETLVNLLGSPELGEEALADLGGVRAAQEKLSVLRQTLAEVIDDANNQVLLSNLKIPDVQGDVTKPLSRPELGIVKERAENLQDEFYQGFLQIPDDMYDALKKSWDEWAQIIEDSGDVFFEKVSEIDPQFFQQAMQQLLEEGKLQSQGANPFGIQQINLESGKLPELQSLISYFTGYLSQNFPQYEQKPEDVGVIFNDYVTAVLHGDNLAIKLALEKLVDINQKQLDGQYNIPEGATFWVPLTAAYYRPRNEGGLGGLGGAASTAGNEENNLALDENTRALKELSLSFRGDLGYSRDAEEKKKEALKFRGDLGYGRRAEEDRDAATAYRGDLGYAPRPTAEDPTPFFKTLLDLLRGIFTGAGPVYGGSVTTGDQAGGYSGIAAQTSAQQINPVVNARLELQLDSTTQLVVDGRVLASVLSPYMAQEMIRLEQSQGTITKRYVI